VKGGGEHLTEKGREKHHYYHDRRTEKKGSRRGFATEEKGEGGLDGGEKNWWRKRGRCPLLGAIPRMNRTGGSFAGRENCFLHKGFTR